MALKLLVRSAPGVCAISCRLIMVAGVTGSGFTAAAFSETLTTDCTAPMLNWKCNTGALPDATVTSCMEGANPSGVTVT